MHRSGGAAVSPTGGGVRRPADEEPGRFGVEDPGAADPVEGPPEGGVLVADLTPGGGVVVRADGETAGRVLPGGAADGIVAAFAESRAAGILHLGAAHPRTGLDPTLGWWRDLGVNFAAAACSALDPQTPEAPAEPEPDRAWLYEHAFATPPMVGAETVSPALLRQLWAELVETLAERGRATEGGAGAWLRQQNEHWNAVGRVWLHLAENRRDPERPFAFLATYVDRTIGKAEPVHYRLGRAQTEFAGRGDRKKLWSLLAPLTRASDESELLRELISSKRIYETIPWTAEQALAFLRETDIYEQAGLVVSTPDWWKRKAQPRPQVQVTVGQRPTSRLGVDALLDFDLELTLGGERLSAAEARKLLRGTDGLQLIRGKWVEVDSERLREVLAAWDRVAERAERDGLDFAEAMRLLAGMDAPGDGVGGDDLDGARVAGWSQVVAGDWLRERLEALREAPPAGEAAREAGLEAVLRPYQERGVGWLLALRTLRLGGCLADDMGLGKTVQALAALLVAKAGGDPGPDLLVAPASLLENWRREAERFAPGLRFLVAHPSQMPSAQLAKLDGRRLRGRDVVLTTYGTVLRQEALRRQAWRTVVLDEAQAIKNPAAKQTRAVKTLRAGWKLALTGTPIENRLTDLWSLFDFLNPGLLGAEPGFRRRCAAMSHDRENGYRPLRRLVRPYILRRLKTDESIVSDLPDKTEVNAWCSLSRMQAALYSESVSEMKGRLRTAQGIDRRGMVLQFLMRFKQICNHPSQWLGDHDFDPKGSGKFDRLREICESVASRQQKALVFTQFREMIVPLAQFLDRVFGRQGMVLHGGTPVKKRAKIVEQFQHDEGIPFLALSLKAGGVGLNLTAASHVIHFDRWWNPAVEDQATDRAYRIGQHRNVLVHKFVCRGTLEERIHQMIRDKREISGEVLSSGEGAALTEMGDHELLDLVSLDLDRAVEADAA